MLSFYLSLVMDEIGRDKVTRIYKRYYGLMTFVAEQTLRDKKDAAPDMVHDAMLKIIDKLDLLDLDDEKKTKSLCVIIVRNKCLDYLRRKDTKTVPLDDCDIEDESGPSAEEIVVSEDNIKKVMLAVESLGERYKDICIMKFVYGFKDGEIAELLGIVPGTVRSRINHARRVLTDALREGEKNE